MSARTVVKASRFECISLRIANIKALKGAPVLREPNKINFSYTEKYLNSKNNAKMPEYLWAFEENTILGHHKACLGLAEPRRAGTPLRKLDRFKKDGFLWSLVLL